MSNIVPTVLPVVIPTDIVAYRPVTDIVPFTHRAGMSYQLLLESLRQYATEYLPGYLAEEFGDMQDSWEDNLSALVLAVNTALAAQKAQVDTNLATTLAEIIAGANNGLNNGLILAALQSAGSTSRAYLDTRYDAKDVVDARYDTRFAKIATVKIPNGRHPITGWFHVDDFGALGDGSNDLTAIQAAVNAANTAYVATGLVQPVYVGPKVYQVGVVTLTDASGNNAGVASIVMKSGVKLFGPGTIKLLNNSTGPSAFFRLIGSSYTGLSDVEIRDVTLDGNRANQSANVQGANVLLQSSVFNIRIANIKCVEANGPGIMVTGTFPNPVRNLVIEDNFVKGCNDIGVQSSQFDGLIIRGNRIENCASNGIDIYGENATGVVNSNGTNFQIYGNQIHDCANGIFPETVAHGSITGNQIYNCVSTGIHVNRINSFPMDILIEGNRIYGCPEAINGTGDMQDIVVRGNNLQWFNVGGVTFGGAGRISGWTVTDNIMNGTSDSVALFVIKAGTDQAVNMIHKGTITRSFNRGFDNVDYSATKTGMSLLPAHVAGDTSF